MPDRSQQDPFDADDEDFSTPPEPEQIWPPPEPQDRPERKIPSPADDEESIFSRDPELAWEDETEKIGEAIDEIRHLDDSGEADQVQTESESEFDEGIDVEIVSPGPEARSESSHDEFGPDEESESDRPMAASPFEGMIAGSAPILLKPSTGPSPRPRSADSGARRGQAGVRRVNDGAEGEISRLWNNVFFSGDRAAPKAVVVTAARRGDGATQVACSLGMIGAESNPELRIAIVDLNLRDPDVASVLGVRSEPGVTDVLEGRSTLEQAIQSVPLDNGRTVSVVASGRMPAHPLSLMKSRQMQALVTKIRDRFDHVIIDVASSDLYPDAQIVGSRVDGALLVISGGSTPRETVADAKKRLDLAQVRCLGLVLNRRADPIPDLLYRIA
ncbi:MAG: CpsD/CapB family tyrosine-protein kinase [Phycisphaerae bacterium]|nr:CpsD/CapB family tyrosine-protein kinase [Phycisphaerae bacterium]